MSLLRNKHTPPHNQPDVAVVCPLNLSIACAAASGLEVHTLTTNLITEVLRTLTHATPMPPASQTTNKNAIRSGWQVGKSRPNFPRPRSRALNWEAYKNTTWRSHKPAGEHCSHSERRERDPYRN